jgi:hypothetical protein
MAEYQSIHPKERYSVDWKRNIQNDTNISPIEYRGIWKEVPYEQKNKVKWLRSLDRPYSLKSKSRKKISTIWFDILTNLEEILIKFRSNRNISEECDKVLLVLYEYIQKITEKDFDYVIVIALQTYINECRIFQRVDRQKAEKKLLRSIMIARAIEDAKRTATELDLEPVKLKQIDLHNGESVYTF